MTSLSPAIPRPHKSERTSLSDEVGGAIREMIMSGTLRPGTYIRMERIAETMGVSITPVREALVALAGDGFVTSVPRRGFIVEAFTRQDVRDLFWTQAQLAGELAARAAERISDDQLTQLRAAAEEGDAAVARGDDEGAGILGYRFHRIINLAADSERLARLLQSVVNHLPNHFYASIEGNVQDAPSEHHAILAALEAHDPVAARRISEDHLTGHATHVIELLEARGLWTEDSATTN